MSYGIESYGTSSHGSTEEGGGSSVTLTIADSTHAHTAENTGLTEAGEASLVVQDSSHGHVADNLTLSTIPAVDYKIAIIGDSNASGRGSFSQTNSAGNAWLYDVAGNVVALADPWDAGTDTYSALSDSASAAGSYVQHLADLLSAAGKSTLWIPANKGGTTSTSWAYSTNTTTCYGAMKARLDAVGGVDVIIIHLGANDAIGGMSQATFAANIGAIIGHLATDFPAAKIYLQKIHHNSSASSINVDAIRAGVDDVWNGSSGCLRGADLEGISTDVHYGQTGNTTTCTAELNEVALRTYDAITSQDLLVFDASHAHVSDSASLSTVTPLSIQDAAHGHASDTLDLTVSASLSLQESVHSHAADSIDLSLILSLMVQESSHAHAADNLTVSATGESALLVQDALHTHFADNIDLSVLTSLVVSEAAHGHFSDIVVLSLPGAGWSLGQDDISAIADAVWAKLLSGATAGDRLASVASDTISALNSTTIPVDAVTGNWPTAMENADATWNKVLP